jgi:formamidopyrimidine-DNA glycosylase
VPELPEVETIRADLEAEVVGRRIDQVRVTGARSVRRHPDRDAFVAGLRGRRFTGVGRRGKYLTCQLAGGRVLVLHLGMSGQLRWAPDADAPVLPHTHVALGLEGGGAVRFVDPRTFGEVFLTTHPAPEGRVAELAHLGVDPLAGGLGPAGLLDVLRGRRSQLKALLMDQRVVAGIGNLYADEILFAAGLRWDRCSASLDEGEVARLHRAMTRTLTRAIRARGSSLADAQYRDLFGRPGRFQAHHRVYGREGRPCWRCGAPIVRARWSGRSSFFCDACQR